MKVLLQTMGRLSLFIILIFGCKKDPGPAVPVLPEFSVLPAKFYPLGGLIENFKMHVQRVGNVPIEEYGVIYAFLDKPVPQNPLTEGKKFVFTEPFKEGDIQQIVKLGFPTNAHYLIYGAYVKAKDGRTFYSNQQFDLNY